MVENMCTTARGCGKDRDTEEVEAIKKEPLMVLSEYL
jgi:hypothetical protein